MNKKSISFVLLFLIINNFNIIVGQQSDHLLSELFKDSLEESALSVASRKRKRCKKLCNLWVRNCLRAGSLRVRGNALVGGNLTVKGQINTPDSLSCKFFSGLDGQVLLGVTNNASVFNYLTSSNGSIVFDTGPATLGMRSFPIFGNVAYVDQVYGNDTIASVNQSPYKTITAALAAAGAYTTSSGKPVTVWVFPGIYSNTAASPETFPLNIPNNVTLLGLSAGQGVGKGGVTISSTAATNLIRMGNNTLIENLSLEITGTSAQVTGISLIAPGNTANVKRVNLNAISTTGTSIGIDANTIAGAINTDTINITVSSNTQSRGILVGPGSTVNISNNNIQATGTNAMAAETIGGTLVARISTLNGATSDISQTSGFIKLGDVRLYNSTANGKSFTNLFLPSTISWATRDNPVMSGIMVPITGPVEAATPPGFGIIIPQQLVVCNLRVNATAGPGPGKTATFTLLKNGASISTITLSAVLSGSNTQAFDLANSVTCAAGDILSIQVANPDMESTLRVVTVSLEVY